MMIMTRVVKPSCSVVICTPLVFITYPLTGSNCKNITRMATKTLLHKEIFVHCCSLIRKYLVLLDLPQQSKTNSHNHLDHHPLFYYYSMLKSRRRKPEEGSLLRNTDGSIIITLTFSILLYLFENNIKIPFH